MPKSHIQKCILIALGIFLLALSLRLPYYTHPDSVVFDEGMNATFASYIVHSQKYFDIHPPLAHLIFALVSGTKQFAFAKTYDIGSSFGEFPYARLRLMNVFLGSLLPVIIFLLAMLIYRHIFAALIPATLIIFDNSLIVYSRAILPDTLLLFFGFGGLALLFLTQRISSKTGSCALLILSGLFLGSAMSIKWTGLGFLGAALFLLFRKKSYKKIILLTLVAFFVYLVSFTILFSRFEKEPGETIGILGRQLAAIRLTSHGENVFLRTLSILPRHTMLMFRANSDFTGMHPSASKPYQWLFGQKSLQFWPKNDSQSEGKIMVTGSIPQLSVFIFIFFFAAIIVLKLFKCEIKIPSFHPYSELLFIFFLINYIPLFFIQRDMFLYHYFTPMIFGFLLIPGVINSFLPLITKKHITYKKVYVFFLILVFVNYLLLSSLTYGF